MPVENLPKTLYWQRSVACDIAQVVRPDGTAPCLTMVDQRKLPLEFEYIDCFTSTQVCEAIADLTVRGAPAIGISGAAAVALWVVNEWLPAHAASLEGTARDGFEAALAQRADEVANVRPTAVNLSWGVRQVVDAIRASLEGGVTAPAKLEAVLGRTVEDLVADDIRTCRAIGENGARVFAELAEKLGRPLRVETHCNAGSLATARYGTATAVIYAAFERGDVERVYVDETRPVDQGARLTAWELGRAGVPYTLVCDNMAGSLMQHGMIDAVVVGADRICANGDVANKIGTYGLAVLARAHDVPFFVAAPRSTFDESLSEGGQIVIEQRAAEEVRCMPSGREWLPVAPQDCEVYNPAFDVTPHELVAQIFTEEG